MCINDYIDTRLSGLRKITKHLVHINGDSDRIRSVYLNGKRHV
jgi:hypothetical protein